LLAAIAAARAARGSSALAAFAEMTRWNLFTGARAAGGPYPAGASGWPMVTKEAALAGEGMIYVEGLSARYVDVTIAGERQELRVAPSGGVEIVGWAVPEGGGFTEGVELEPATGGVAAVLEPGTYTVVVTGQSRASGLTPVHLRLAPAPPEPPQDVDGSGGCQAGSSHPGRAGVWLIVSLLVGWRRRRRAGRQSAHAGPVSCLGLRRAGVPPFAARAARLATSFRG
jgi:hypothetical protein